MKLSTRLLLCLSIFCTLAGTASASLVLSLRPDRLAIGPQQNVTVDVVISGLQSGGVNSLLGAFDLTLQFDPDVLQLLTVPSTLGTALGDPADPGQTLVGGDTSTPGLFRFFEVSFLEASLNSCVFCTGPYLENLQSDSFTLASLVFYAPGPYSGALFTTFMLVDTLLSDAAGNEIDGVTIRNAGVRIPEPDGWVLLATAAFAAAAVGRRRRIVPVVR